MLADQLWDLNPGSHPHWASTLAVNLGCV